MKNPESAIRSLPPGPRHSKFGIGLACLLLAASAAHAAEYDLVVYGGTSAGVIAAVQAKKMGKSAVIICPDKHLGGLSSGGLGFTDTGNKAVIGGLAREFYHRVWQHYQKPEAWKWQKREEYGNKGQGTPAIDGAQRTMWIFEPHVAEKVFEDLVREHRIPVHRGEWLDRSRGVTKSGARITAIRTLSGNTYAGRMFIDATYEGDLMAAAGIDYHVGREAKSVYGEQWNGVQTGVLHHRHHFGVLPQKISPWVVPGDPSSGALPRVSTNHPGEYGAGDNKVQAYCYRMCLTDHPENRVPFPKPDGYDAKQYELLLRVFQTGWRETFDKFDPIPNHKTDVNNHGPMSTDNIGFNYDYPEASYERRREILREHRTYQQGLLYFIANDPRVPQDVQNAMLRWGLSKDEFADNGHWPRQIYVREARRMKGHFVMTENELLKKRPTPDSVGMGSYTIDSHNVQRYITPEGYVQNEGDIGVGLRGPYQIAYGSLVPKKQQCENLLVPVCVSSSHIAFGSIRMEPVFMILGQSAATAAIMAIDDKSAVQEVPYPKLAERLLKDGQVLEFQGPGSAHSEGGVDPAKLPGVVVDDTKAQLSGAWTDSRSSAKYVGHGYQHDGNAKDGKCSARFETKLPDAGRYEVRIAVPHNANRASNARVEIIHANGTAVTNLNQKRQPPIDALWLSLGTFDFGADKPAAVVVSNERADGYVVIDAVQWLAPPVALVQPVQLTAEDDRRRLMDLLNISALRRGVSGNAQATNAANYDETKANPFPKLPDPLVSKNGQKVTTAEMWWQQRRPEILEDFEREIYGRTPRKTPAVKWSVTNEVRGTNGDIPIITKHLVGRVDNSSWPPIEVDIALRLTTPANATAPVPVMMQFGFIFSGTNRFGTNFFGRGSTNRFRSTNSGPTWQQQVLSRGWGYAVMSPNSVQADNGAGLTRGIIGLVNKGQPRKPDDWGALAAWAWGASRALDYFQSDKSVDAKRVGIQGHSRYGKAALVAMALDPRFAIAYISSSGAGGAKLHRRNFGEVVENVAAANEYHWMAGNYLKYVGPLSWADLPVDSHQLIALCAPRPVFIGAGATRGDGWVDAKGSFMAAAAAGPVYRLLGKRDLGTSEFPPIETSLVDGDVAFRQHAEGHTEAPNWPVFLQFADRYFR